jgi:hypothetical protein
MMFLPVEFDLLDPASTAFQALISTADAQIYPGRSPVSMAFSVFDTVRHLGRLASLLEAAVVPSSEFWPLFPKELVQQFTALEWNPPFLHRMHTGRTRPPCSPFA